MNKQIIAEIMQKMLPSLDNLQMRQLQQTLENVLFEVQISKNAAPEAVEETEQRNEKLTDSFISAKRVEGCSEKTLKYYRATIEKMIASIGENICRIRTDDLR